MIIIPDWFMRHKEEGIENTIGVIRSRKSKKDGQYSC